MRRLSSPFLRGGNLRDSLGTTLNGLLERISPQERRAIREAVRAEALSRGIVYYDDDNQPKPTPVLLRPRVLGGNQRAYLHRVTRILEHAYMKLLALWQRDAAVREILPLNEREARWIRELHDPAAQVEVFFGRFDASTDFGSYDWLKSTQFFEFNPLGAGGTYVAPTVDDIILRHVAPALRREAPTLLLESNDDPRRVLLEVMADHARLLVAHLGENLAMRDFRKHTSWYLTGYPVGGEVRRQFSGVSTISELEDLIAALDSSIRIVEGGERIRRGHTNGPIRVALPAGYLDHLDDLVVPDDSDVMALSGG